MGHENQPQDPSVTDAVGCGWSELDQLVSDLLAVRRAIAAGQAREARLLADAVELVMARMERRRLQGEHASDPDLPLREVALELGMAFRVSDRTIQTRMGDAHHLVTRFAATHAAWSEGRIDAGHAWAIARTGLTITSDGDRERFERLALDVAATESPGRMAAAAKAIAATVAPADFAASARRAIDDRCVRVYDLDDGLARLIADLPAALAYGIRDRLTALATSAIEAEAGGGDCGTAGEAGGAALRADDRDVGAERTDVVTTGPLHPSGGRDEAVPVRTLEQARADVLADLLLAGAPAALGDAAAAIAGHVHLTIPALTLAGAGTEPALLEGYGPIDLDAARLIAGLAPVWNRVFTDPETGTPVAVDRYRPSVELRRFLRARDERCRTPGCTRTAGRSDLDHNHDAAAGGETSATNLCHFCRRHHVAKHKTAWRVRQLPGGVIEWTGPTGRRHHDRPPATVRFVPEERASESMPATASETAPPF